MRQYTCLEKLINNVPYIMMMLLGAAVFVLGLGMSTWAWIAGVVYFVYGVVSAFWIKSA